MMLRMLHAVLGDGIRCGADGWHAAVTSLSPRGMEVCAKGTERWKTDNHHVGKQKTCGNWNIDCSSFRLTMDRLAGSTRMR